jgi:hypothetical protein
MYNEAGVVGKELSTFTAFVRPVFTVDFLVLNEITSSCTGFPTLVTLKQSFPSEDTLVLNKHVCIAESVLIVSQAMMTLSTMKGHPILILVIWFLPCVSGHFMGKSHAGQKALPNFFAGKRFP